MEPPLTDPRGETPPPSDNEREYVVLRRLDEPDESTYHIDREGRFPSRQAALEAASGDLTEEDLEQGVDLVAVPGSYFKHATIRYEQVRQVKWEDG